MPDDARPAGQGRPDPPVPAVPVPLALAPFDRRVIGIGAVVFAVLMALSARYGFDRDELYFLDCARHLQASYVDQPVLTPLIARLSLSLFGVSEVGRTRREGIEGLLAERVHREALGADQGCKVDGRARGPLLLVIGLGRPHQELGLAKGVRRHHERRIQGDGQLDLPASREQVEKTASIDDESAHRHGVPRLHAA